MKNYTEQRLEEFDKKFKIMERIAHEEVDGTFALIEDRDKVKDFIAESIQQAVAEEIERIKGVIENWEGSCGIYVGAEAGQKNEIARKARKQILDLINNI